MCVRLCEREKEREREREIERESVVYFMRVIREDLCGWWCVGITRSEERVPNEDTNQKTK